MTGIIVGPNEYEGAASATGPSLRTVQDDSTAHASQRSLAIKFHTRQPEKEAARGLNGMSEKMRVCVIIPTKNRPEELERVVRSLLAQSQLPESLIIVDQSQSEDGRRRVKTALASSAKHAARTMELCYILDPAIAGAATARNRAMVSARDDIWVFLDDDVVLEPDFIKELLVVYRNFPRAGGVSGVITNYTRPSLAFRIWTGLFMRGPFHDERQSIYWNADRLWNSAPLPVSKFGAGLMSFRADTLRGVFFDENLDRNLNGVSDGEDVDFCSRLQPGTVLLIAPRARLQHRHSAVGRLADHWLRRHARGNLFLYRKHWRRKLLNRLSYGWLWLGCSLVAIVASLRRCSLEPWSALRLGLKEARAAFPELPK